MVVRCKNKLHDQTSSARCLNAVNVCVTISVTNTRCFTCSVITFYEALMLNMVLQTINASLCQFCQTRCFSLNLHAQNGPIKSFNEDITTFHSVFYTKFKSILLLKSLYKIANFYWLFHGNNNKIVVRII